jgi:hypothetical protein
LSHAIVFDPSFHQFLLELDREAAAETRAGRCRECKGPLDVGHYPRKPRGGPPGLGAEHDLRFSFCCRVDGCRTRHAPPTVRFLGRKVWLAAVVVLATAMQHGLSPRRVRELRDLFGVSERTLRRWRGWWVERFARCSSWTASRGHFATPVDDSVLPLSLLERFEGSERDRLVACLRFLRPVSLGSARHGLAS